MGNENITLTEAEWRVMECLWERSPRTGRETTLCMEELMGWSRSTTLTLLRRLEDKGAITTDAENGLKVFKPLVRREDAAVRATASLIERMYKGSISMMVSAFAKRQTLSKEEIDELYNILKQAEEASADE